MCYLLHSEQTEVVHSKMSTVIKENKYLHFCFFWKNPKDNFDRQDYQQGLNLLHTYVQLKISFGVGRGGGRMKELKPIKVLTQKGTCQWT